MSVTSPAVGDQAAAAWADNVAKTVNAFDTGSIGDTGWLNMASLGSGWTNDSTAPQARQIGSFVYLRGGVVNATFNTTTFTTGCTLPAGVAAAPVACLFALTAGTVVRGARILSDRTVQFTTSAASGAAFRLEALFYLAN